MSQRTLSLDAPPTHPTQPQNPAPAGRGKDPAGSRSGAEARATREDRRGRGPRQGAEARGSSGASAEGAAKRDLGGTVIDPRVGLDRRHKDVGSPTGLERRRGPGRRLSDFVKSAEEGELTPEQFLFLMAIEAFKKGNARMYPSWTDVLEVIRLLGYRKTRPSELSLTNAEDWLEAADAEANVRPANWQRRKAA